MLQRRDLLALGAAAALPAGLVQAQPAGKPADTGLTSIGFASCFDQIHAQQDLVEHLAAQPFDLFLFGGDNVYYGGTRGTLADAYGRAAALPGYTALRRKPHLAVWDDNDYGPNDGGADFAGRQDSKDQFQAFWKVPADDPRRARPGLYHARSYGPPGRRVQVILLDTRWFRSRIERKRVRMPGEGGYQPDTDPAKTMLGEAQWAWLEEQLRTPADLRLVVSSIQVLAEGHSYERWGNLPAERERLVGLIRRTGANGVVLLSGDRHFAAFYRREPGSDGGAGYPLTELTSSGVTHFWPSPTDEPASSPARVLDRNYATIDIDWAQRQVVLAARNLAGNLRIASTLQLDQLKA
ncbi:MAG: alkaline phosphatase family protein [Haliea sp.]|nr:MAG: alkaline phosphatase family protein [Haliea sp.]